MRNINFFASILGLLLSGQVLAAISLPKPDTVPGGIAVIPLASRVDSEPYVTFEGQRVMVISQPGGNYAIVGIPLSAKPGTYQISLHGKEGRAVQQAFTVHAKTFPTQYLTIKNKRKVNPNPQDLQRIEREHLVISKIKNTWTADKSPMFNFGWPLKGRISSEFGLQRIYNGEPRSPHAGLDIAAPMGTPIKSPAAGRVIGTGHFFYSGNTVYVDHGQGLISMYGHMSKINVKLGQAVNTGTVLGLVGQTGRATGPHLHWGVLLNKTLIDPRLLVQP